MENNISEYIGLGEKSGEQVEVWVEVEPDPPIWLGTIDDLDIWA